MTGSVSSHRHLERRTLFAGAVTGVAMLAAGLLHLVVVPDHLEESWVHGLVIGGIGVVQLGLGLAFVRRPSVPLFQAGLIITSGPIWLWANTRVLRAPFMDGPEPIQAIDVLIGAIEIVGVIGLVAWFQSARDLWNTQQLSSRTVAVPQLGAVIIGISAYFTGIVLEYWMRFAG